ncbi:MAG TPA: TonB-dependent receptor [Verrucomicrobiae bacterium]|nr:TonB-dependent receptor [Verrucomicrobiae bacterium]
MITKRLSKAIVLGWLQSLTVATFAQSTNTPSVAVADTNATDALPEINIIGHATPRSLTSPSARKAVAQKREIPGGFTIKTTDDMQKGRTSNFQDLLQGVPGVQSENGTEISKVSIRGSGIQSDDEPVGVEFLLDGMSFDQGDGETIMEDFDVSTLNYAEIYRGADALKYGSLTLGGAVNLVPLTGYDADAFHLQVQGGSYGFIRAQASSGGVDGAFDYYASLSGRSRDGFRAHSKENTQVLFSDLGYKISNTLENRFYLTLDQTDRQLPGGLTQSEMQADPEQADPLASPMDYHKQWYYLRLADKLSYAKDGHELNASLYWWHRELKEKGPFEPDDFRQGIQIYHSDNCGVDLDSVTHSQLFGQRNILTVGMRPGFETEQDHNYENLAGNEGATIARDLELSVNVPFYDENQHYLTDKLSLITGIQAIYVLRQFYDYFDDTPAGDQTRGQNFFALNPKIGLLYELNKDSQVFFNFSRSFQPPSFDNMVDFGDDSGESLVYTPLNPQHAWTAEIGTRGKYGRFDWDLALYHSWVRNELQDLFDPVNDVDRGDVNVAHSYHQGIEAGLGMELWNSKKVQDKSGHRVTLQQTYTLNNFHFDHDPVYGNNRLAAIPIHVYETDLMYEAPCGFYAGPNVQCNLTRYPVDQQNTLNAGAYALLGFKAGYTFNLKRSMLAVFFEVKNLTDKTYAAAVDPVSDANPLSGFADPQVFHPGDRRSFYGGVSYSW